MDKRYRPHPLKMERWKQNQGFSFRKLSIIILFFLCSFVLISGTMVRCQNEKFFPFTASEYIYFELHNLFKTRKKIFRTLLKQKTFFMWKREKKQYSKNVIQKDFYEKKIHIIINHGLVSLFIFPQNQKSEK